MSLKLRAVSWLRSLAQTGRNTSKSRLGFLLCLTHILLLLCALAYMSPPSRELANSLDKLHSSGGWSSVDILAGRPYHYTYESPLFKILFWVDLPAMLVAYVLLLPLLPIAYFLPSLPTYEASYVFAGVWLIAGSIEWWYLGYRIERRIHSKYPSNRLLAFIKTHYVSIAVVIASLALFIVPLVYHCSIALGEFRHGSVSFGR